MPTSRVALVLYAFIATSNVMASASGNDSLFWATKPLLMPLLAAFVIFALPQSRMTVLLGLAFACVGDIALMIDSSVAFFVGMAAFAVCHGCYTTAFARRGAWRRLRRWPWAVVPVVYATAVVVATLGLGLPAPVVMYSCVLALMASSAAGLGWLTGVGGTLFFVSDLLIGLDLAGISFASQPEWVMFFYVVGQGLIVYGWVRHHEGAPGAGLLSRGVPRPRGADLDQKIHTH
jgi:uncharacterized membrane protein YhhN